MSRSAVMHANAQGAHRALCCTLPVCIAPVMPAMSCCRSPWQGGQSCLMGNPGVCSSSGAEYNHVKHADGPGLP